MIQRRPLPASLVFLLLLLLTATPIRTGPLSAQTTPPEAYLGFKPGADFHLMTYEEALGYFETLASETDRMIILDMGETTAGRRMKYGVISSPENLRQLDHYKEINRRISLPYDLPAAEARELAEEGRTIVWIDGGLHGTEVAPAQLLPQLAHDLVTGEDETTRSIRDNVITLLVFANPDGMTIVSDWYMSNVGTPYETSPIPWLYHEYVGHDNNRDSFMGNLVETRNMNRAHSTEWFPEILYNQHQTGPFPARIWTPPDAEPTNPNVHPLVVRWKSHIGTAMGKAFDKNDQPGAISRVRYDTWYPGYATQVVDGHNVISILTETQLYRYATPQHFTVNDFPPEHRELTKGVFYPNPWLGGWWRLGDAVAYNHTACMAVLEVAARYREELLLDKYKVGTDVLARFREEPPYGYIVPVDQHDPASAQLLLERMLVNGIEVHAAQEAFEHNGISYPAGTYVLPTSQPFGLFLKNLFERQSYPDLRDYPHLWQGLVNPEEWQGGPLRPYDGVGWTLPLQMGVESWEMSGPLAVETLPVAAIEMPGTVSGSGGTFLFSHGTNTSTAAAIQLMAAGGRVSWTEEGFSAGGRSWPAGTYVLERGNVSSDQLQDLARETGVTFVSGSPRGAATRLEYPRIGLHKAWVASMDAGWINYILDSYGIPFESVTNAEIRAGRLKDRFDVLVFADQRPDQILNGHPVGTVPPNYVGGIGDPGFTALRQFLEDGGRVVCNNSSCDLFTKRLNLPVQNALDGVPADSFNCPGAILKADFAPDHPMVFGMPERDMIFFSGGRAYEMANTDPEAGEKDGGGEAGIDDAGSTGQGGWLNGHGPTGSELAPPAQVDISVEPFAWYPREPLLLSGWMIGDELIRGKAAAVDVSYGEGKVLMFGFNVHNRGQARSTMRMFFNALLYR